MVTVQLSDEAVALLVLEEEYLRNSEKFRKLMRTVQVAQTEMEELSCRQIKIKQVLFNHWLKL